YRQINSSGKNYKEIYPPKKSKELEIGFIYSLDWSPDGKQIAFSFLDRKNRKIALYDTAAHTCKILCDTKYDERDPSFSPDGNYLYFSSDRTGIFNVARNNEIKPGKFFKVLYKILLGAPQGPRLGPYVLAMGKENVIDALKRATKE
ncbi:MAG: hypothetical protein P8X84_06165, partial [Candidatus Bathyarchaeota archaeon]